MTKTEKVYRNLIEQAKKVTDREHTRLYVSSTVSAYIRKQVSEKIRKQVETILVDKELGVITDGQFEEETSILRLVYKSL